MLRCAIIGFGKMGRIRARTLQARTDARICWIHDPALGPDAPYPVAPSAESILGDPSVDAVFVCTPNHLNRPLTIAALERGKHVLCEKPPAFTATEVEAIRAVERRSGATLMFGFNHRHHGSIVHAKALVDSGELGRILWMRGRYGKSVPPDFFAGWRANKALAGGGIMLDQGIHMLDLMLHFAGEFDEVQAMVSNLFWQLDGIEDNVFVNLRNRHSGVAASIHSTMTQWRHIFSLEVFLERGHLVLNGLKTASNSYGDEVLTIERNRASPPVVEWDEPETRSYPVDDSWAREVDQFITAIREGSPVTDGSSTDALRVMGAMDRIYASATTR